MAAHAENGRLGHKDGYPNACAEARLAQDWKALLGYSEALLAKQPDHAEALAWKGEALARLGRFDASAGALKQAVAANPKDPAAWNNLGRAALQRKDWAEAREAFDRALALEPGQLEARFNRGIAHFNLKAYAASRDDFAAALALKPGDPLITSNLKQAERALALTAAAPKPALPDSNQAP